MIGCNARRRSRATLFLSPFRRARVGRRRCAKVPSFYWKMYGQIWGLPGRLTLLLRSIIASSSYAQPYASSSSTAGYKTRWRQPPEVTTVEPRLRALQFRRHGYPLPHWIQENPYTHLHLLSMHNRAAHAKLPLHCVKSCAAGAQR